MFKKIILWIMRLAVITFIFYYGWFLPTLKWEGRDFPQESDIQYSEGRFFFNKIRTLSRSGSTTTDMYLIENGKKVRYYCGYSAYHVASMDSCLPDDEDARSDIGKTVRVGWYYQKDFLGFHNPHRQLVYFEVDGKNVYHFLHRKRENMDDANFGWIIISVIANLHGCFVLFLICASYKNIGAKGVNNGWCIGRSSGYRKSWFCIGG